MSEHPVRLIDHSDNASHWSAKDAMDELSKRAADIGAIKGIGMVVGPDGRWTWRLGGMRRAEAIGYVTLLVHDLARNARREDG